MGCHSFVIKVMNRGKIEQLSVACAGSCDEGKPCKPRTRKFVPEDDPIAVMGTVCYCDDETHSETCPACGHEVFELTKCRIGTVHQIGLDEEKGEPLEVTCFGKCEKGTCTQKTIFRRELDDGRVLELLECACSNS